MEDLQSWATAVATGVLLLSAAWWLLTRISRRATKSPKTWLAPDRNRSVRVFISSTFIDMHAERDFLVTRTFPALRAAFRERGVELIEIDLRWGVRQEDVENGRTLPICLAEVDRCRPYFIGLLGERYGSVLSRDKLTPEATAAFPILRSAIGRSLTEIEIMHGALRGPRATTRAMFFVRDPAWLETLTPAERAKHASDSPRDRKRLAALKRRIRAAGAPLTSYTGPESLGEAVEAALKQLLASQFPDAAATDKNGESRRLHDAFARERRGLHVGGEANLKLIDRWWSQAEEKPLLITGSSGGGKSALISNWVEAHRHGRPQDIVFEHYLGASPDSGDPILLVRRLWDHLNTETGAVIEVPNTERGLLDGLFSRLVQAGAAAAPNGGSLVIALDGLDKLSSHQDLRWLPADFPPGVRLLASTLDGASKDSALARGWKTLNVEPLTVAQRSTLVERTLASWGRALSSARLERVMVHPLSGTPLFLKTLLTELRFSGTEAKLDARLDFYLAAQDMSELFQKLLERLETDFGRDLSARAACLIWASRAGLEETELIVLASANRVDWAGIRNTLGEALRDQNGRLTFSHDFLRRAVEDRYLPTQDRKRDAHLAIAEHFSSKKLDRRQAEEAPFQLHAAQEWGRLQALLTDLDQFDALSESGNATLLGYWLALQEQGRDPKALLYAAFQARAPGLEDWTSDDAELAGAVAALLNFAGMSGPEQLGLAADRATALERLRGGDHDETLESRHNLAVVYSTMENYTAALREYETVSEALSKRGETESRRAIENFAGIAEVKRQDGDLSSAETLGRACVECAARVVGPEDELTLHCLNNLSVAISDLGRVSEARDIQKRIFEVQSRTLGKDHVDTLISMGNLALSLSILGDHAIAGELEQQVFNGRWRVLGPQHEDTLTAGAHLASSMYRRGDLAGARGVRERIIGAYTRHFGAEHPRTLEALSGFAATLTELGEYENAQALFEQLAEIRSRTLGPESDLALTAKANIARVIAERGDRQGAEKLQREVLEAFTRIKGADAKETLSLMNNLAASLKQRGALAEAKGMLERVLEARVRLLGREHLDTLTTAGNLGSTLHALGDLDAAARIERANCEALRRVRGDQHFLTLTAMSNLAATLTQLGDAVAARELLTHVFQSRLARLGPDHPDTLSSKVRLAVCIAEEGRPEEAQRMAAEAVEVLARTLGEDHETTLVNKGQYSLICRRSGDLDAALKLAIETTEACAATLGESHEITLVSRGNLAGVLGDRGQHGEAQVHQQQVLAICEKEFGPNHFNTMTSLHNLGVTLAAQGKHMLAVETFERVLEGHRALFGLDHHRTRSTQWALANSLFALDDVQRARDIQQDWVERTRRLLGPEHPETLSGLAGLAATLAQQKVWPEAQDMQEFVVEARSRVLGPHHPDTLTSMAWLLETYRAREDGPRAQALAKALYEARAVVLGGEHETTLDALNTWAIICSTNNEHATAAKLFEDLLEKRDRLLGPESEFALSCRLWLAMCYLDLGQLHRARDLQEMVLGCRERFATDADDPKVLNAMKWLSDTLVQLGEKERAVHYNERILEARTRTLGPDHVDTLKIAAELERLRTADTQDPSAG